MMPVTKAAKQNPVDEYLKRPYARILIPNEDGTFSAEILEFSGCFAQGDTADEAIAEVNRAAREWIESALRHGREIPEPSTTRGYSGTISLRLPKAIHRHAARMAEREGVSLNQYLLTAIAARVGADDLFNRVTQRLQQTQFNLNAVVLLSSGARPASTERQITQPPIMLGDMVTTTSEANVFGKIMPAGSESK
jgi:predicted RNase H-like HicB family nuclease